MQPYQPLAYQGPRLATVYTGPVYHRALGQTFDQILGWPACTGDICRLAFHAGATALGIHVGLTGKGGWALLGWVIAVGQGIAGALDVVSLVKRALGTHPPEP